MYLPTLLASSTRSLSQVSRGADTVNCIFDLAQAFDCVQAETCHACLAEELVRTWQATLRKETRALDIQIRDIGRYILGTTSRWTSPVCEGSVFASVEGHK
jgi:hypothetical protein